MTQAIIDFTPEQDKIIKAYRRWKCHKKDSKPTVVRTMIEALKIPERFNEEE